MVLTYSYDPTLSDVSRLQLDYARTLIGDTDVDQGDDNSYPYTLMPDETYINAFLRLGWSKGLSFLCTSLMTKFGQQPDKYAIANGVSYQMGERIPMWRDLRSRAEAGQVDDPLDGGPSSPFKVQGTTACNVPVW